MSKILTEVLSANQAYASTFGEKSKLALPPARGFAILTCMDARLDPAKYAGLSEGDAHVIRNAGGRASTEALKALALSQAVMHTREVMVVHHTECALGRFTEAQLDKQISEATGQWVTAEFDCFTDPVQAVIEDLQRIRACAYLAARNKVRGFIYDLAASSLTEVANGP
jgi:carbonic anhydrase